MNLLPKKGLDEYNNLLESPIKSAALKKRIENEETIGLAGSQPSSRKVTWASIQ